MTSPHLFSLAWALCACLAACPAPERPTPSPTPVDAPARSQSEPDSMTPDPILDVLANPTVKATIAALQRGDRAAWAAQFTPTAALYDDGKPRSLEAFTRDAIGHEHFKSIERVSADGLEVIGDLHTEQWGDFKVYFRFALAADGKIQRLDIGQAR